MSRSRKIDMAARINMRPISAWSYERDPAADAETDAMIMAFRQKLAKTPLNAGNVRPVISTPTASSPAALPVERVAEYLHSDPNGPEIKLASMIVDQQLEAEAAVAAAARMKADEERAAVSAAAPNRPIHDWSDEALDVQIRSEINAHTPPRPVNISAEERDGLITAWSKEFDPAFDPHIRSAIIALRLEEWAIARESAIAARTPPWPVMPTPTASSSTLPLERVAEYLHSDPRKTALPAEVQAEEDEEFPFDAATTLAPSLVSASMPGQPPAEEGSVVRSDIEQIPNDGVRLEANPHTSNNRNTVGSKRTGVRYELGKEDAEYLADVLEISVMDARTIMRDVDGANGYQVLRVVMPSIANILKSRNKAAYVRAIVRANVKRIKAQNPDRRHTIPSRS